jgi:sulfonate transport system substrate-binding protein
LPSTRTGIAVIVGVALAASAGALALAARDHRGVFARDGEAVAATTDGGPGGLPLDAPLPDKVPPGVTLIIGDPMTQRVLEHTGWIRDLPFKVKWAQITGGPAVTEAFHAHALDVGVVADVPPIHATWVGIPVKIIAVRFRKDPQEHPTFVFAVAPGSKIQSLADLRGKRIAFSPGQVQGEIVLRSLAATGLTARDATLVELPSTSADFYVNALVGGMIDAAPIGAGAAARHYLTNYGAQGARLIRHSAARDDLAFLYVRTDTVRDPAKAAALRAYVAVWARANAWISSHPDEWARIYYQGDQGLSADDARYVVAASGEADIPRRWNEAVGIEQSAIDLMAQETHRRPFAAGGLFDRRFEPVAADAFAAAQSSRVLAAR